MIYFQDIIKKLKNFWRDEGCIILEPYDMHVGAGTFHPLCFFNALGNHKFKACYVQPSRRPDDARFGENSLRSGHYYQFQVILKFAPENIQDLYLKSLSNVRSRFNY